MRDNVLGIDAIMADGSEAHFGPVSVGREPDGNSQLLTDLLAMGAEHETDILAGFPKVLAACELTALMRLCLMQWRCAPAGRLATGSIWRILHQV